MQEAAVFPITSYFLSKNNVKTDLTLFGSHTGKSFKRNLYPKAPPPILSEIASSPFSSFFWIWRISVPAQGRLSLIRFIFPPIIILPNSIN
jgi:hypothetical protein